MLRVINPGVIEEPPTWLRGAYLQLAFGDVDSEADAKRCHTRAPTSDDLRESLTFSRGMRNIANSKMLISCDYGASRSPAIAYVLLADELGPGRESEAYDTVLRIRPIAVPNTMVVRLGDAELNRGGALLSPLEAEWAKILSEVSRARAK